MGKVLGIVGEYNPFHNGHLYHLEQSKKMTSSNYTVAIMGGNFTQRGSTSLIDKWSKAEAAIQNGIDLVIELPVLYTTSSAENFADGAIKILDSLKVVDYISFGAETSDVDILNKFADVLYHEPRKYKILLSHELSKGISYPKARENALMIYLNDIRKCVNVLSSPNNILGIEYLKALKKYKPESILILGTSDGMVEKIAANLGLPEISEITYISDVATQEEMETARRIRVTEGKHVIPVPTFEIKKDFSGYLLDPLQIFKTKGKGQQPYISEKSIIRPTFSYLGKFTISDLVFRQILEYLAVQTPAIHKILKARVDNFGEGVKIYMEVSIVYGFNVVEGLNKFKEKSRKEIEKLTAMNVVELDVVAKNIYVPQEEEEK